MPGRDPALRGSGSSARPTCSRTNLYMDPTQTFPEYRIILGEVVKAPRLPLLKMRPVFPVVQRPDLRRIQSHWGE
jgi:hypothetical protein